MVVPMSTTEARSETAAKKCTSCGTEKERAEFYANRKALDGLMSHCVTCRKARYGGKAKEYARRTYLKNRTERLAAQKVDRAANREQYSANQKRWYAANCDKVKAKVKAYRAGNLDKIRAYLDANREERLARRRAGRPLHRERDAAYSAAYRAEHRDHFLDYMTQYNAKHRERLLVMKKAWREANRDAISEKFVAWYEANREQQRERGRAWAKANPDKTLAAGVRRRTRIAAATIQQFTLAEMRQRIAVFGGRCAYCGGPHEHMDHVKPIAKGGPHCLANLRPACAKCNMKKNDMDPKRWLARVPRTQPLPLP